MCSVIVLVSVFYHSYLKVSKGETETSVTVVKPAEGYTFMHQKSLTHKRPLKSQAGLYFIIIVSVVL